MPFTYQDVVLAHTPAAAWALLEASGTDFAPYVGGSHLTGSGVFDYRQTSPVSIGFSLGLHVGAKLALSFVADVFAPDTFECFFQIPSMPISTDQVLFYNGTSATNGTGLYVKGSNRHLIFYVGGSGDRDTNFVWPDATWHLVEAGARAGGVAFVAVDGLVVWQSSPGVTTAPSPNVLYVGGDAAAGSSHVLDVAWPAFYAYDLSPSQISANNLARTDPDAAIVPASGGGSDPRIDQILAAVYRSFPPA